MPQEPAQEWLAEFAALPWREAVAKAEAQGRTVRIIRPGTPVTRDFRPDRLNVHLDAADEFVEFSAY